MMLRRQAFGTHVPLKPRSSTDMPAAALAKAGARQERRWIVTGIPRHELDLLWSHAWPLLERAATRTNGGTEEEVVRRLLQGDAQLWCIFDGQRLVAAATTQITLIGDKGCRLWLVGGKSMVEWAADFLATVEPWACSLGCAHVWGTQSRAGWRRIVRQFGGEPTIVDGKPSWMRRL